jgi:hypothetical protein
MNRYLLAAMGAAALVAACSSGGSSGSLGDPSGDPTMGGGTGGGGDTQGTDTSGGGGTSSGGNGATSGGGTSNPPPPSSGPGSMGSAAHQYFVDHVNPSLQTTCSQCHNTGAAGAPMMMSADANVTYQNFDARGLVVDNSLLLTKGSHAAGAAPALTSDQQTLVTTWLQMEKGERAGAAAPVNILSKIGACLDKTKFDAIGFQNLKTTPRQNEDPNRCEGCNNAPCRTCHTGGDGGFYMAAGSNLDQSTFQMTQTEQYIVKYIGLNGTTPTASNAIMTKAAAVKTAPPYSHPLFTLSTTMQSNINAFVQDAVTKYNAKTCGQ